MVIGTKYRIYKDRLEFTYVEMDLEDCKVTAACFSETNDILFLGDSKGCMRFVNLQECLEVTDPEKFEPEKIELNLPYVVEPDSSNYVNKPISSLQRFTNQEEDHIILVTINDEKAVIYRYNGGDHLNFDVDLHDLGGDAMKQKLSHMYVNNKDGTQTPYDFTTGMYICNSQVALNSRFFCIGLCGDFDHTQVLDDKKRVNDKNSVVGIYRFDDKTNTVAIEYWINQYPFKNFFVDDNLTTIMFLGRSGRRLDFHFILWDFDLQTHLKEDAYRELITLDNGLIPGYDDKEDAEDDVVDPEELAKVQAANSKTTCCTLF